MRELERIFREELVAVTKMAPKEEVEKGEPLGPDPPRSTHVGVSVFSERAWVPQIIL